MTLDNVSLSDADYRIIFESVPGLYLILLPNSVYTIVAASDAYLKATMTLRSEIVGRPLFDVFPDNPKDPAADGVSKLQASLGRVLATGKPDVMAVQKYDVRRPEAKGGEFEVRYWSPINSPVIDQKGKCTFIIHRVEDVTEFLHLKQKEAEQGRLTKELQNQASVMELEILQRASELEETNRRLREANLELQAFADTNRLKRTEAESERRIALENLRNTEEQLLQAQKLEALGRLAGGVSHDFNNLLTAIIGYADLSLNRLGPDDTLRKNICEIRLAGQRAAGLTRQLLAFSRKQLMQPRVLNLNHLISNLHNMLIRMIGEDIDLRLNLYSNLGHISADPGQVEQIIMNLAVNARDAMPFGGKLSIETADVYLDEAYAREHISVVPGPFVMLAVNDSGVGMDEETRKHIFEPFFTTKEAGKGTGLGLSTVYGIVKQSGGNIWVYSELGKGTSFKVYFPRISDKIDEFKSGGEALEVAVGTETILLVEDADVVRALALEVLEASGYRVLEAANPQAAMEIAEAHPEPIQLLVTDVVMPESSGSELARRLRPIHPEMRVVFMSGYTEDTIITHGMLEAGINFIQKPFTPDELARRVRSVLDEET